MPHDQFWYRQSAHALSWIESSASQHQAEREKVERMAHHKEVKRSTQRQNAFNGTNFFSWIFFSLADYQNHLHFASLQVLIFTPRILILIFVNYLTIILQNRAEHRLILHGLVG